MTKNCLNCQHVVPPPAEGGRAGWCPLCDIPVNARMRCEEWRSNDIIGAVSVGGIRTQKHT